MNISETIEFIHSVNWKGSRLGLDRIIELLELLDSPHKKLKFVHVAGTNGKGSTCAMISSILSTAGYKTGLHTSPHLLRIHERFIIDGKEISDKDLGIIAEKVKMASLKMTDTPTEFEIIFAMALLYYCMYECDIVVLEVGLGGELDATNCIPFPEVAVITSLALDHTEFLGNTLKKIARVKAGIIKEGCTVVVYPSDEDVNSVYKEVCSTNSATLKVIDFNHLSVIKNIDENCLNNYQLFNWKDYKNLPMPLIGFHQLNNAAVALEAIDVLCANGYDIDESDIRIGLSSVKWPARMEILSKDPVFILDGGHNTQGTKVLFDTISHLFPNEKIIFIMGVLKDKNYEEMISIIRPLVKKVICLTPDSDRSLPAEKLSDYLNKSGINASSFQDEKEAIMYAIQQKDKEPIVAFGSLYMAGLIRKVFPTALTIYQRKNALNERNILSVKERDEYSSKIAQYITSTPEFKNAKTIMIYKPTKNEVNLNSIIEISRKQGKKVSYPYCKSVREMQALIPKNDNAWITNKFNILEPDPANSSLISPSEINLIICPCVAVDENKNRIGMGAGYYDRYLAQCTDAHIIGVAFECQTYKEIMPNEWDIPMHTIITEERIIQ